MKSSTEFKPDQALSILLVGDPKSGKTCVAASFPAPYFLDVDGNLASAHRVLAGKPYWFDTPTKDVKEASEVWKKSLEYLIAAKANPDVKTIVVDSLSLLSGFACEWLVSEHVRMGDSDKNGKKIAAMTIPDYGSLLEMFRRLIFGLRQSNKYVIVTSHQQGNKDEVTGAIKYALAIPGQAKDTLGGAFSDVWACVATPVAQGRVKYTIRTRPTGFHVALGTSIRTLDNELDITDKTPAQIWSLLEPKLKA
jgi:archaellum biogenesis ATPase FlaH